MNKDSHLTKLIIWRSYVQRFDSGLKDILNHVRQKYWVTERLQPKKEELLVGFSEKFKVKSKFGCPRWGVSKKETSNKFF